MANALRDAIAAGLTCPANVSFATDILPLFNEIDIEHMQGVGIDLSSYDQVKIYAHLIYEKVSTGEMPPPPLTPWTADQVNLLACWIQQGEQP